MLEPFFSVAPLRNFDLQYLCAISYLPTERPNPEKNGDENNA